MFLQAASATDRALPQQGGVAGRRHCRRRRRLLAAGCSPPALLSCFSTTRPTRRSCSSLTVSPGVAMMGWLLRRSPLSSGVPLEGSDTVQARLLLSNCCAFEGQWGMMDGCRQDGRLP